MVSNNFPTSSLLPAALLTIFAVASATRTMMGEPLNPGNYEDGRKMVIPPNIEADMTYDDGTMNDIKPDKPSKQNTRGYSNSKEPWPNAELPYLLDSAFTSEERAMIAKAIAIFHEVSCVRVKPRTVEPNYVVVKKNAKSSTCSSEVGFQTGRQSILLAHRCILRPGSIIHEFMHALGFHHEQSRQNRDDFITVFYDNIIRRAWGNFDKTNTPGNDFSPYDTLSITHYSEHAFTIKKDEPSMLPKTGDGQLGQRTNLTKLDIQKINGYYNCGMKTRKSEKPQQVPTLLPPPTCRDMDPAYCKLWSDLGHCQKSYMFMSVFCKLRCGKCDMPCTDMNPKCPVWARKKYCSYFQYADYMNMYCQKSCRICV